MRARLIGTVVVGVLGLALACRHEEQSVTGPYGASVIAGQVSVADGRSPTGVEVSVVGTGLTTMVDATGRFAFVNAPAGATLRFQRPSDGIEASITSGGQWMAVELSRASGSSNGRLGGEPAAAPIEGRLRSVGGGLLVVNSSRGNLTVMLTRSTAIRRGDVAVLATSLVAGDHVRVRVSRRDDFNIALEVVAEAEGEDDTGTFIVPANGLVASVGDAGFGVRTAEGRDLQVRVTPASLIRKHGLSITSSEIHQGDRVETFGTRVDDRTLSAIRVELEEKGSGGEHGTERAEIYGRVAAIAGRRVTAAGTTVRTDGQSVIRKEGQLIAFAGIHRGDVIEARGSRIDATTILADQIQVEGDDSQGNH